MFKAVSLFGRKKTAQQFKHYYSEWIATLKNHLLPLLRRSMSASSPPNLLHTHVDMINHHFQSYYDALDLAAAAADADGGAAQLLFPDWRNCLEKPFLWLGDLHPYLFTNLLRHFLEDEEDEEIDDLEIKIGENSAVFDKNWNVVMAWKSPSKGLMTRIDQIECGLRLMVPALVARAREAQAAFVERVGAEWGRCQGQKETAKAAMGEAVAAEMEEITSVFIDANRLRRSVLADIMAAISVYQAALFLEGLSQFLVGFRDRELLAEFERCKISIN